MCTVYSLVVGPGNKQNYIIYYVRPPYSIAVELSQSAKGLALHVPRPSSLVAMGMRLPRDIKAIAMQAIQCMGRFFVYTKSGPSFVNSLKHATI